MYSVGLYRKLDYTNQGGTSRWDRKIEGPRRIGLHGVFGRVGLEIELYRGWMKAQDWLGRLLPTQRSIFAGAGLWLRRQWTAQYWLRCLQVS